MTIDLANMMITLEADNTKLTSSFEKGSAQVRRSLDKIDMSVEKFQRSVESKFAQVGTNAARRLTGALAAGLSFAAIERFVSSVSESAATIKKQSAALGLSTDSFQELSLSAKKAGIDQDSFNTALDFFAKSLGEAQLKTTPFGTEMKKLGVDVKGETLPALMQLADVYPRLSSYTKRAILSTMAFGRAGVTMTQFMGQGSAAIRAQGDEFKSMGAIIEETAIQKIDELGNKWSMVKAQLTSAGANVLAGFANDFSKFAGEVGSPAFQSSMKQFGADLATIAKYVVEIGSSPWFKYIAAGGAGFMLGGPLGAAAAAGGVAIYKNLTDLGVRAPPSTAAGAKEALAQIQARLDTGGGFGGMASEGSFLGYAGQFLGSFTGKGSDIGNFLGRSYDTLLAQRNGMRDLYRYLEAKEARAGQPIKPPVSGTPTDLTGTLDSPKNAGAAAAKVSQFAKAVSDLQTKTAQLAATQDDSAKASAEAEARTRLLEAAQADGLKVTAALKASVGRLAAAYSEAVANRAFAKDMKEQRDEIAALNEQANSATLSIQALAEAQERAKGIAKFHAEYGDTADINAPQFATRKATIGANAAAFGIGTANAQGAQTLLGAKEQNEGLQRQIAVIGLYGGALAEATARLEALDKASHTFGLTTESSREAYAKWVAEAMAAAKTTGVLTQQFKEGSEAEADRVKITDELRSGLSDMASTGIDGFKNLNDTAASFLKTLANMILQIEVMDPILKGLFGDKGTSGGGIFGSLLNSLLGGGVGGGGDDLNPVTITPGSFGYVGLAEGGIIGPRGPIPLRRYAGGGIANSPQFAMFGEGSGPEAFVPLKGGAIPVALRIPKALPARSGNQVTFAPTIDARGAQVGVADQIDAKLRAAFPVFLNAADRQNRTAFPERLRTTLRDRG